MSPLAFNILIMCLYLINAAWWAYHKSWGDVWYWSGAFWITAAVTFGYNR
jgi:hypothetical protein